MSASPEGSSARFRGPLESRGIGQPAASTAKAGRRPAPRGGSAAWQFQELAFESSLNAARIAAATSLEVRNARSTDEAKLYGCRPACALRAGARTAAAGQDAPELCAHTCASSEGEVGSTVHDAVQHLGTRGGQLWEVVGGEDKGGIVVRRGRAACSPSENERLATGSVVEELALEGDRLHYRRLTGAGPESGWVRTGFVQRDTKLAKTLLVKLHTVSEMSEELRGGLSDAQVEIACPMSQPVPRRTDARSVTEFRSDHVEEVPEVDEPVSLWRVLDESDPVAKCLGNGTKQFRGLLCDASDMSLFELLRAELLRIERDKELRRKWEQRGIWSSDGHRLSGHDFVLRRLTGALNVEGLSWASNLYEDAAAACQFHHDGDKYGGGDSHNPNIKPNVTVVASFGATRNFTLRHDDTQREFSFPQLNGDVITFDRQVDEDFMHGLHPGGGRGDPRISVVVVGKLADHLAHQWAPRFQSNVPLWLPPDADRVPRLLQFAGIFAREAPHNFTQDELSFFALRGSRVPIDYHRLLAQRFKDAFGLEL